MKEHVQAVVIGSAIVIGLFLIAACGGKQTVASKSAEALRQAQQKGLPIGGEAHGGHSTSETSASAGDQSTMTGMDHSTMTGMDQSTTTASAAGSGSMAGMDHSNMNMGRSTAGAMAHSNMAMDRGSGMAGMDHSNMPGMQQRNAQQQSQGMAGMDHSNMPGMQQRNAQQQSQGMAGMDHSNMPGMQQRNAQQQSQGMAGMDHSNMPGMQQRNAQQQNQGMAGMDHSNMPGMQQRNAQQQNQGMAGMDHSNMPGMQTGAATERIAAAPTSNADIQRLRPAATLKGDAFDAPVPVSVSEAIKSAQGGGTEGQESRSITPGQDHENPPTPAPAFRDVAAPGVTPTPMPMDHTGHGARAAPAASSTSDHSQHGQSAQARTAAPRQQTDTTTKQPATGAIYTCPMHPDVTSDRPGNCPKCGMALVKKQ